MSRYGPTGVGSGPGDADLALPISKASLGRLAYLKFASFSVVWDARRKFKDLPEHLKAFLG